MTKCERFFDIAFRAAQRPMRKPDLFQLKADVMGLGVEGLWLGHAMVVRRACIEQRGLVVEGDDMTRDRLVALFGRRAEVILACMEAGIFDIEVSRAWSLDDVQAGRLHGR